VVLSFWQRYHTEHDADLCKVEISSDGQNWEELAVFSGVKEYWHRIVLPLSDYLNHFIFLRFVLSADETCNDPGWDIRNIKIVSSVGSVAGNDEIIDIPTELYDNIPNPFRTSTKISFSISRDLTKDAKINIYNLKGQKVRTFTLSADGKDSYSSVVWDGKDEKNKIVSSGIYFYELKAKEYRKTRKMLIIK